MTATRTFWDNFPFATVLIPTPQDGHCLFHSICNSFHKSYRTEMLQGKRISRLEIVTSFRSELAQSLEEPLDQKSAGEDRSNIRTRYELLGNGNLKQLGDTGVEGYTLPGLQAWLRSSNSMGEEIIPLIQQMIEKNFYFLDTRTKDVYITSDLPDVARDSIVMYYNGRHYDLCAVLESDGSLTTYFTNNHPFIQHIRSRLAWYKGISLNQS
jgi:hypothetical protein